MAFGIEPEPGGPRRQVIRALEELREAFSGDADLRAAGLGADDPLTRQLNVLASGLAAALEVLGASLGECQVESPYAPIAMVRRPDGTLEGRLFS